MARSKNRLVPNKQADNTHIGILREMLRQIDFEKEDEKQEFTREVKGLQDPLKLYFLREDVFLHFSFEGFGDLMGHELCISHQGSRIDSAYVNHVGDVTLLLTDDHLPSGFRLTIGETSVA